MEMNQSIMGLPHAADCTRTPPYSYRTLGAIHFLIDDLDSASAAVFRSRTIGRIIPVDRADQLVGPMHCQLSSGDTVVPAVFQTVSAEKECAVLHNSLDQAQTFVTIGSRTQVLLEQSCDLLLSVDEDDDEVVHALTHEVRTSLLGYANRYIGTAADAETSWRVGSLLLTGQSGAGCSAAARSVAGRHGARLVRTSCAEVYASAPGAAGAAGGRFTRRWGRTGMMKLVLKAAVGMQPCVLLLEDLHFLVPSGEHFGVTEASEGLAEVSDAFDLPSL